MLLILLTIIAIAISISPYYIEKKEMAKKKNKTLVKLASSEGTGIFYVREKNNKVPGKLEFSKYDKKLRKHVRFNEKKLSS